jgi:hypothetical protein
MNNIKTIYKNTVSSRAAKRYLGKSKYVYIVVNPFIEYIGIVNNK